MKQSGGRHTSGFTIVELLIVVVVIAILAAITIVAYNGIQNRAYNASVSNDISGYKKKLEMYKIENGHYPQTTAELSSIDIKTSAGSYANHSNALHYCATDAGDFAIGGASKSGNAGFVASSTQGVRQVAYWNVQGAVALCNTLGVPLTTGDWTNWSHGNQAWSANGYTQP